MAHVAILQGFHGCLRGHLPAPETASASPPAPSQRLLPASSSASITDMTLVHLCTYMSPWHLRQRVSNAGEALLKRGNLLKMPLENSLTTPYHRKTVTAPIFNRHHPSVPTSLPSQVCHLYHLCAHNLTHPLLLGSLSMLCRAIFFLQHPSGTEHKAPSLQQAHDHSPLPRHQCFL